MASAVEAALGLIARHPYTAHEVRRRLVARGYDDEEARSALARLEELGYLDDLEAARATVRLRTRSGRGRRAIASELRSRGCSEEVLESALSDFDEEAVARTLFGRELGQGRSLETAVRHLRGRGFPDPLIVRLVEEARSGGREDL